MSVSGDNLGALCNAPNTIYEYAADTKTHFYVFLLYFCFYYLKREKYIFVSFRVEYTHPDTEIQFCIFVFIIWKKDKFIFMFFFCIFVIIIWKNKNIFLFFSFVFLYLLFEKKKINFCLFFKSHIYTRTIRFWFIFKLWSYWQFSHVYYSGGGDGFFTTKSSK